MSRKPRRLDPRILFTSTMVVPLCLAISGCGGGGGAEIASIPAPPPAPTPAPTPGPTPICGCSPVTTIDGYTLGGSLDVRTSRLNSPATENGKYDVLGRLSFSPNSSSPTTSRMAAPGEFSMSTNLYFGQNAGDAPSYTLNAPADILPDSLTSLSSSAAAYSWDINRTIAYLYSNPYEDVEQDLGQRLTAFDKASDGTEKQLFSYDLTRAQTGSLQTLGTDKQLRTELDYDIGNSYVAMGEWSWNVVNPNGDAIGGAGSLLFVNGERTPAAAIPASGTATYDARTLHGWVNVPFTITADFGQRMMSTSIDQDYRYNPAGDIMDYPAAFGIHVAGSAPFSNAGSFDIPLTGTVEFSSSYAINTPQAPPSEPATGSMDGAFFGPNAENVGGTFGLNRANGTLLLQDAFVGQQHHP
jgi:hypothetical protein